jgi:hypothetical protein
MSDVQLFYSNMMWKKNPPLFFILYPYVCNCGKMILGASGI